MSLPALAATFTVDEPDDALSDGVCSLGACTCRDAFDAANASAGSDTNDGTTLTITSSGTRRTIHWTTAHPDECYLDRLIHTQDTATTYAVDIVLDDVKLVGGFVSDDPDPGTGTACPRTVSVGGGCVAAQDASVTVTNGWVEGCNVAHSASSTVGGGAILAEKGVTLTDAYFLQSSCERCPGGAVLNSGDLTVTRSELVGHSTVASGDGGTFYLDDTTATVTITESFIESGTAAVEGGGGWFNVDSFEMVDSEIFWGSSVGDGGGLHLFVPPGQGNVPILTRSLLYDNDAGGDGGGLALLKNTNGAAQTLYIENSTISTNTAHDGGGFYLDGTGASATHVLRLESSTVYGNSTTSGSTTSGALIGTNMEYHYRDSIQRDQCGGPGVHLTLFGNVVETHGAGQCNRLPGDRFSSLLTLDALDNASGGVTRYHETSAAPIAVDWLATCNVTEDQRNVGRPIGGVCDSGAFER